MFRAQTTTMGKPITAPVLIPVLHAATPSCIDEAFMVDGEPYSLTCLSFGSPYGAVLVEAVDGVDVTRVGSALGTHALFPQGASIVFYEVRGGAVKARLWQKGGAEYAPDAACVALTAAAMRHTLLEAEADVTLGGKTSHVCWDRASDMVTITESVEDEEDSEMSA